MTNSTEKQFSINREASRKQFPINSYQDAGAKRISRWTTCHAHLSINQLNISEVANASDLQLLARYHCDRDEEAFAALVNRHTNLVYSTALRQVRSPQLAEEVAQAVFADLAGHAGKLKPDTILTSWLYQVARRTAIDAVRKESRRQLREQIAVEMHNMNATTADWTQIEPLLDDAMAALDETDRAAVLLRYFENQSLREVGAALGISDDTAQKRVSRAVEQLREFFTKRKVTIGASGLVVLISANAVQAAPIGLAATISAAAVLTGTAVHTTTLIATTKTIAMTTIQKTLITAAIAAAVGAGIYEVRQAAQLREQNQTLQQQQAPLAEQVQQLQAGNESLSNRLAETGEANKLSEAQFNELLRLRGQAGQTRTALEELAQLKSQAAREAGKTPDNMSSFMESLLAGAQDSINKAQQAQVDRMKKMLNLTDDQAQAISNIMQKNSQNQSLILSGKKMTPEQMQALASDPDAEIKALLTPDQLAAYQDNQQAEKATYAETSAKMQAEVIAKDFILSQEQQEQIHAAFYQMYSNGPADRDQAAVAAAVKNGNSLDAGELAASVRKSELEGELNVLGNILTPEQLNTYRQEAMDHINALGNLMNMAAPQKPAGATN